MVYTDLFSYQPLGDSGSLVTFKNQKRMHPLCNHQIAGFH
jgi:hypothetical protein